MKLNKKVTKDLLHINPLNLVFSTDTKRLCILKDTSLNLVTGHHYALIGKNGVGKTSLLNMISDGNYVADIIYVKQEECVSTLTVIETLILSNKSLVTKKQRLLELQSLPSEILDEDRTLLEELDDLALYIKKHENKELIRAQKILSGLGFTDEAQNRMVQEYSGGWRMRISLAKALFMTPTLLLLDEPSNHLDLSASIWLAEYLRGYPKAFILVSHDIYLIDETCTTIIYIHNQKLTYYRCNYSKFQDQLELEHTQAIKKWKLFDKKVTSMKQQGKSKGEIEAYISSNNVDKPSGGYYVKMNFLQPRPIKGSYIYTENVTIGYDTPILKNVSLFIEQQTRISIVGNNGAGKSTIIKLLVGELQPMKGNITRNEKIKIGYYGQQFHDTLPLDITAHQYLMSLNDSVNEQMAHRYLGMFGLESQHHGTTIGLLSGGQKARVKLASFGVIQPHLLLLDEPTNHLDITTIASLISALNNYKGALVIITHNFDFITKLNTELWVVKDEKFTKYPGTYDDYVQEVYTE